MARIYQTENLADADVRVAIVERGNADLLVQRVSSLGLAQGDALWHLTHDRQDATTRVVFVSPGMAQLSISFVDSAREAGWTRPHRWKGRLSRSTD